MGYAFGSTFVTRESKAMEHQNTHPRSQREYELQRARLQAEIDKGIASGVDSRSYSRIVQDIRAKYLSENG